MTHPLCVHCLRLPEEHLEGKCLFSPTRYRALTLEDYNPERFQEARRVLRMMRAEVLARIEREGGSSEINRAFDTVLELYEQLKSVCPHTELEVDNVIHVRVCKACRRYERASLACDAPSSWARAEPWPTEKRNKNPTSRQRREGYAPPWRPASQVPRRPPRR